MPKPPLEVPIAILVAICLAAGVAVGRQLNDDQVDTRAHRPAVMVDPSTFEGVPQRGLALGYRHAPWTLVEYRPGNGDS